MSGEVSLRPELNGRLFRPPGDDGIWIIDGGRRRRVTPAALSNLFVPDPEVASMDVSSIVEGNTVADAAILAKAPENPSIYLIDRNPSGKRSIRKRHVVGTGVLKLYQFSTSTMMTVPAIVLDNLPTGAPVVGASMSGKELIMANWDSGQVSTLTQGQTLTCTTLASGQIYAIILYNNQGNDQNATVNVVTSNSTAPVPVTVPGTTANEGLASIVLVSGSDTSTVAISITSSSAAPSVQAWIGSVSMPTNTAKLNNQALPTSGAKQPFAQYDRYYAVPASKWYTLTITSSTTQFISVQFQQNYATVYICNPGPNATASVTPIGPSVTGHYSTVLASNPAQTISTNIFGNGTQWVWMNTDSSQDSATATIALQALSGVMALE